MKVLTSIGHGGPNVADIVIPGATPVNVEGGAARVFGKYAGPSAFEGGWEGKREKVDRAAAREYIAKLPRDVPFVSNFLELRYDDVAVEQVAIVLREARRRNLVTGHYGAISRRPAVLSKPEWQKRNDRAMRVWKPLLKQINPDLYFRNPGETCQGELVIEDRLVLSEVFEVVETITECRRVAGTTEEIVPVISDRSINGATKSHFFKNKQQLVLLDALGIKTVLIWTDTGMSDEIAELVRFAMTLN